MNIKLNTAQFGRRVAPQALNAAPRHASKKEFLQAMLRNLKGQQDDLHYSIQCLTAKAKATPRVLRKPVLAQLNARKANLVALQHQRAILAQACLDHFIQVKPQRPPVLVTVNRQLNAVVMKVHRPAVMLWARLYQALEPKLPTMVRCFAALGGLN